MKGKINGMKIAIIGGAGFIGGYLISILRKQHEILIVDKVRTTHHRDVAFMQCDIRNLEQLHKCLDTATDMVILLAAEHKDDVSPISLYYDVNVQGTRNVLEVMNAKNITNILFTSSVSVYGLNRCDPDEASETQPFNHYGKSKLQAEELLRSWYNHSTGHKTLTIVRPTVVFGPGNKGNVFNLLQQIVLGKFVMVGKGENKKSMAYVENVAGFLAHCAENNKSGYNLYNYVDKPDISTKDLVARAEESLGKKLPPIRIPYTVGLLAAKVLDVTFSILRRKNPLSAVRVQKFCATTQFHSTTIQKTSYKPPVSLHKGLDITIKSILHEEQHNNSKQHLVSHATVEA